MSTTTHPVKPEKVMAFLDGELAAAEAQAVLKHLDHCAECAGLAGQFRCVSQALSAWNPGDVPAILDGAVADVIVETRSRRKISKAGSFDRAWNRWPVWVGAAAAAAALVLFAIATPNLLRSRMAANEASAVGSLRTLNTALASYSSAYGHFPFSLQSLGPPPSGNANEEAADLVDSVLASGRKSGYIFTYRATPADVSRDGGGYAVYADPGEPGTSGSRHFSTDQTGVIRTSGGVVLGHSVPAESPRLGLAVSPMVARTAQLKLIVEQFENARSDMERVLLQHQGYVGLLSVNSESGSTPTLTATLHVPADQLDACIGELRKLGRITQESQSGEEVTAQHADLVARLKNSHNTEIRLNEILRKESRQTKDVLEVEKEAARVRGEIERMVAEKKSIEHRVEFATVELRIAEEYKAKSTSPGADASTRFRNAFVTGYRNAWETTLGVALFLVEYGPTLFIWLLIVAVPVILVRRRYRKEVATV